MSELMAAIDAIPDSVSFGITVLLVLALCALSNRQDHASPGPDAEKASGVRQGESPTEGAVVSGPTLLADKWLYSLKANGVKVTPEIAERAAWLRAMEPPRLEQAPACDQALDLSQDTDSTNVLLAGRSPVVVRSTAAGAPAVIYRWRRPGEAKRLIEMGWELEFIEPEYGSWLIRKEERWP